MQRTYYVCVYLLWLWRPRPLPPGPVDQALMKLGPEERAHQACVIKGIETVRKDKRLRQADRMKTGSIHPAQFTGTRCDRDGRRRTHAASLVRAEIYLRGHGGPDEG